MNEKADKSPKSSVARLEKRMKKIEASCAELNRHWLAVRAAWVEGASQINGS